MIRIKDYLFNENEIREIETYKKDLMVEFKDTYYEIVENATFEDIEFDYEYKQENEYVKRLNNQVKELEEEKRQIKLLKDRYQLEKENYKSRTDKIIEYIQNNREAVDEKNGITIYWLKDSFDEEEILNIAKGSKE